MQQRFIPQYLANVILQDIMEKESIHFIRRANKYYLTQQQRLDLCIEMMRALEGLHKSGVNLGGAIAISDIMPQQLLTIGQSREEGVPEHIIPGAIHTVNIRIHALANQSSTAKNYKGWKPFPTSIYEKDIVPGVLDAKTDVCLFGRIFLQLWFIDWRMCSDDQHRLSPDAQLPKELLLSEKSEAELMDLLRKMNEPKKEDRPTTQEVIEKLVAIRTLVKNASNNTSPLVFTEMVFGAQVSEKTKEQIYNTINGQVMDKAFTKMKEKISYIKGSDKCIDEQVKEKTAEKVQTKMNEEPPREQAHKEVIEELSEQICSEILKELIASNRRKLGVG